MKVLILHADFGEPGGVGSYYRKLRNKFTMSVEHHIVGRRGEEGGLLTEEGIISKTRRVIHDYAQFMMKLRKGGYQLVHVNPSLDYKSFLRDGIFVLLARMLKKKTVVFFRGWQKSFEYSISRTGLWLFKFLYGSANAFIVLSEDHRKRLEAWGCAQPIYKEVTVVDDDVLRGLDINKTITERQASEKWRVLFLSRVRKDKGIYETIEAVWSLRGKYPKIELVIAGNGPELQKAQSFVQDRAISNVLFAGYVKGEEKNRLLKSANVLCLPTCHDEGLPNSVLECMAFGLPIITRPMGGIADFFRNGEHGFVTDSKDSVVFAEFIEKLLVDKGCYRKISVNNYQYAQSHFLACRAALRLEKIYMSAVNK